MVPCWMDVSESDYPHTTQVSPFLLEGLVIIWFHTLPSSATIEGSVPCVMTTIRLCVPHALGNAANFKAITSVSSVCNMKWSSTCKKEGLTTDILQMLGQRVKNRNKALASLIDNNDCKTSIGTTEWKITSQPRTEDIVLASVSFPKSKST